MARLSIADRAGETRNRVLGNLVEAMVAGAERVVVGDVSMSHVRRSDAVLLSDALAATESVTVLHAQYCSMSDTVLAALTRGVVASRSLTTLDLTANRVSERGVAALVQAVEQAAADGSLGSLQHVVLDECSRVSRRVRAQAADRLATARSRAAQRAAGEARLRAEMERGMAARVAHEARGGGRGGRGDDASSTTTSSLTLSTLTSAERSALVAAEMAARRVSAVAEEASAAASAGENASDDGSDDGSGSEDGGRSGGYADMAKQDVNRRDARAGRRRRGRTEDGKVAARRHRVRRLRAETELLDSGVFSDAEVGLLAEAEAWVVDIAVGDRMYHVNVRARMVGSTRTALCMHGFGAGCQWASWAKLVPEFAAMEMNAVFVDLPGFGRSSGRDIQTGTWRRDAAEIVYGVCGAFGVRSGVSVVGHCGGAATGYRAMVKYPELFAGCAQVAHNSVIAAVPAGLPAMLAQTKARLWVTWEEDEDHMRHCAAYKTLDKLRKAKTRGVRLVDIGAGTLDAYGAWMGSTALTRGCRSAYVFAPSDAYRGAVRRLLGERRWPATDELGGPPTS